MWVATSRPGNSPYSSRRKFAPLFVRCGESRIRTKENIMLSLSPTRRGLLATAAASAALSFLPGQLVAAVDGNFVRPFRVSIPDKQLLDLRQRVLATRWPDRETIDDRSQGVRLENFR